MIEIINKDNISQNKIYSTGNSIKFPSFACLNNLFTVIEVNSGNKTIVFLYDNTLTQKASKEIGNTYFKNADCVSIDSEFVCVCINEANPETHYWIFDNCLTQITGDINIIYSHSAVHGEHMIEPFLILGIWDLN